MTDFLGILQRVGLKFSEQKQVLTVSGGSNNLCTFSNLLDSFIKPLKFLPKFIYMAAESSDGFAPSTEFYAKITRFFTQILEVCTDILDGISDVLPLLFDGIEIDVESRFHLVEIFLHLLLLVFETVLRLLLFFFVFFI